MVYVTSDGVQTKLRKMFASLSRCGKEQITVFQCRIENGPTHLIFPSLKGTRWISLDSYKDLFKDLSGLFSDTEFISQTNPLFTAQPQMPKSKEIIRNTNDLLKKFPESDTVKEIVNFYGNEFEYVVVDIDKDGLNFPIAYAHASRADKRLFLPTRVKDLPGGQEPKWDDLIFTVNTTRSSGQSSPMPRLHTAFRWDLMEGFQFPQINMIRRIVSNLPQPNHNFYMATLLTDLNAIPYIGPEGTVFIDKTNLHIVRFESYGNRTLPMVNGCFLTQTGEQTPYSFGGTQCIFEEEKGRVKMTDDVGTELESVYYIYPSHVKYYHDNAFLEYEPAQGETAKIDLDTKH